MYVCLFVLFGVYRPTRNMKYRNKKRGTIVYKKSNFLINCRNRKSVQHVFRSMAHKRLQLLS